MKFVWLLVLLLSYCYSGQVFSLSVSAENADRIGEKIWKNECAGTVEGLTNWKKGENFASLGIGHFIWYSEGKKEKFQETFPDLLTFLQENESTLPAWLTATKACPWNSREEFYENIQSPEMISLREFLFDTRALQAVFIANRLETSFALILNKCPQQEKNRITAQFTLLAEDPNGLYALIDYLNFKGAGISPEETYNGQGWGLLQVLQDMPEHSTERPVVSFVNSAKKMLEQRVKNSPPERNENQWLKGWFNRLDTYLRP